MTSPIARLPGQLRIDTTVATTRAVDAQAKVTGGASNYAAQSNLQASKSVEERRKAATDLISQKKVNAAMAALPTLRDMKRSDEDDEELDEHGKPRKPRDKKRKPPIPPIF